MRTIVLTTRAEIMRLMHELESEGVQAEDE